MSSSARSAPCCAATRATSSWWTSTATRVIIAFRGMCAGCQSAELTRSGLVEAKLRELVSEDIVVEEER
jgi:Fe-S cluster biogenesis protein NfuA